MGFPIIDILGTIINKVIPDPKVKADLQLQLAQLADKEAEREHAEVMGQIAVNTEEAKNSNLFVAGWRPAVGWICAAGVGYSFVLEPFAEFIAKLSGYNGTFPALDVTNLMTLMMGMLGMGYLRTKEKINGVPDSDVSKKKGPLGLPWPF